MAEEFKAASGADVMITAAPFQDAMALKNAIAKELAKTDLKLDIKKLDLNANIDLNAIIGAVLVIDSSEAFNVALQKCLIRCTYNKQKVTYETFEPEAARGDYYEIVAACLKANLQPFFKGLNSKLSMLGSPSKSNTQG